MRLPDRVVPEIPLRADRVALRQCRDDGCELPEVAKVLLNDVVDLTVIELPVDVDEEVAKSSHPLQARNQRSEERRVGKECRL